MKMYFGEVVTLVEHEREYQDTKHGAVDRNPHTIGGWILLMESELAEAKEALIKGGEGRDSVMHEILQVTALGFAALQQHGLDTSGRSL